jgi:hypothetical protein
LIDKQLHPRPAHIPELLDEKVIEPLPARFGWNIEGAKLIHERLLR